MATLLVGYDLNRPGQDYNELIKAIKAAAELWWHYLDSTWLVTTSLTSKQLRDRLTLHIDSSDELLVIDVTSRAAAWGGFEAKAGQWIKDHL